MNERLWWKERIIYQIYPRSFQDSNGDGIGDIPGIISRLDYLAGLGVGGIWISPIYPSPMADFGYDISDYCGVDSAFGSLDDVDRLVTEAHRRDIKVIFDLVLNHTSDRHPWFVESRKSRDSEKRNYYIWSDTVPNNWEAAFGGRGWTLDEESGQYYFHSFLAEQPDLNWRNPETVEAVFSVVRFWLDKGIDGFRLDVINAIVKDDRLRNNPRVLGRRPRPYDMQRHLFDRNRPETHRRLRELRHLLDSYEDRMSVGEIMVEEPGEPEMAASYLGRNGDELHLTFDFSLINTAFDAERWTAASQRWYEAVGSSRWPSWVLNNHDVHRSVSRFKNNRKKARLAALFLLTQRGTVFLYYGEELGLPDSPVHKADIADPLGRRYWPFPVGRDPERGPMVWTEKEKGHGFSVAKPWLPFARNAGSFSVEAEDRNPGSMLTLYRDLIGIRNNDRVLQYGTCRFLAAANGHVMAYLRSSKDGNRLVLLNFSGFRQRVTVADPSVTASRWSEYCSTDPFARSSVGKDGSFLLAPYRGVVYTDR